MLLTAVVLLVLPPEQSDVTSFLLIGGLSFLYWLTAQQWGRLVPRLLKYPLLTGADVFISFGVLSFEGPLGPFFLSTVVASAIGGLLFRVRGVIILSAAQILCYIAAIGYFSMLRPSGPADLVSFQSLVGQPAYYPIVGMCGLLLRRLFDQQQASDSARRAAEANSAAADERARLAREMHDSLAKTLRGIAMSAKALPLWTRKSPERAALEAERIATAAEIASREARELIADLREDQTSQPLAATIQDVASRWSTSSRIPLNLDVAQADAIDLPLVGRYELTAILKEALTNIERHSEARHVEVRLVPRGNGAELSIHDDGKGFDVACEGADWLDVLARAGHYGMVGMHERAKRAGADLTVKSTPNGGATVFVAFAVTESHAAQPSTDRQPAEAG